MKRAVCVIVTLFLLSFLPARLLAGSWYVSVNGLTTNSGSFTSPWPISYGLSRPSTLVLPGDTVWLRGGVYLGHFSSGLSGTGVAPVVVRNYPNERAVLMGNSSTISDEVVLTINGQYSHFIGLEITTNASTRISAGSVDPPPDIYTANGVYIYGQSAKLINCSIHNCPRGGIGYWSTSLNAEVYGCFVFNNGYTNTSRGHGPGLYVQNSDEAQPKRLVNSFVFNGFSIGIQFYSSSSDFLRGFLIDSCTVFNSGANTASNQSRRMNLLAAGANASNNARVRNFTVTSSIFYRDTTDNTQASYMPYSSQRKNVELGTEDETLWDVNVKFNNNHLYGDPAPLLLHKWDSGSFRNNFIYAYKSNYLPNNARQLIEQVNDSPPFANWDFNTYFTNQANVPNPFSEKTFAAWKSLYRVDSNSTHTNAHPAANYYFVRQNRYEPHKYYITVQNYTGQNIVPVPLINPAMANVSYAVFDVQYSLRTPVDTGTYTSSSIPVNMTLTAVAPLTGTSPVAPKHSSKTLGTFVIEFYPEFATVKAGNWNDPTVWATGKVPQYFNKVRVNHTLNVTANAWCKSVILKNAQTNVKPGVLINIGQQ
ncbi:MAG: hypothetical protein V4722_06005 [Bacteroidota bacterium]